jgi:hypothetical protein
MKVKRLVRLGWPGLPEERSRHSLSGMSIGFPSPATTAFAPFVAIPLRACLRLGLAGLLLLAVGSTAVSAESQPWLTFPAQPGPGNGKHLVFVSGDEEYRSEESLPMLAAMLAQRHGFRCTVLFAIHPQTGAIDPNTLDNIPGLHALTNADLMVICTRFRQLPDAQMAFVGGYLSAAKPVIGIRPAVVAFRNPAGSTYFKYSYDNRAGDYRDGFGQQVLGSTWISHHGAHGKESTRGLPVEAMHAHPILRGVGPMWGPSDVYTIRTPIPRDGEVLAMGQVLTGMKPDDPPSPKSQMPLAWTTRYPTAQGAGRVFMATLGASQDFANTLPASQQPEYPGDLQIERRIKSICRWNAMAMVVYGNKVSDGLGGHISSYASMATLYEVGYNHFFRGGDDGQLGRPGLFPGPRHARQLRPRLPRRPALGEASPELPPRARRGRRAVLLPASVPDAGLLAVPDRLHGPRPDQCRSTRRASTAT